MSLELHDTILSSYTLKLQLGTAIGILTYTTACLLPSFNIFIILYRYFTYMIITFLYQAFSRIIENIFCNSNKNNLFFVLL